MVHAEQALVVLACVDDIFGGPWGYLKVSRRVQVQSTGNSKPPAVDTIVSGTDYLTARWTGEPRQGGACQTRTLCRGKLIKGQEPTCRKP
jgi:hypothetical protein